MAAHRWDEDELQVVPVDDSDDDSDSPLATQPSAPLAAWETVDEQDIDTEQADHKFDLPTLFNLAPRDGKGSGSGYDDTGSLTTFATGCSQLTKHLGTFENPNFEAFDAVDESSADRPLTSTHKSTTGANSNVSDITSASQYISPSGTASVASAPADLESRSCSPTNSTHRETGEDELSHAASAAASMRKTGVTSCND